MTRTHDGPSAEGKHTVWPVLALAWLVSVAQVLGTLRAGEDFGPLATLAALVVFLGFVGGAVALVRHLRSSRKPPTA